MRPVRVRHFGLHIAAICALALVALALSHDLDRVTVTAERAFGAALTEVSFYEHEGEGFKALEVFLRVDSSTIDAGQLDEVLDAAIQQVGGDQEVWLTCTAESDSGASTSVGYTWSPDGDGVTVRTDPTVGGDEAPTPGPGPSGPTDPDTNQGTSPGTGDGTPRGPGNGR